METLLLAINVKPNHEEVLKNTETRILLLLDLSPIEGFYIWFLIGRFPDGFYLGMLHHLLKSNKLIII